MNIVLSYKGFDESFVPIFSKFGYNVIHGIDLLSKETPTELIVMVGGEDINPRIYNERVTFSRDINVDRDNIERNLINYATRKEIPILGICRGSQLVHAVFGGKLAQDLYLCGFEVHGYYHPLEYRKKDDILKLSSSVVSTHHQGVIVPGMGFTVKATYKGIVEYAEHKEYPIITTQFHPEWMVENDYNFKFFEYIINWAKDRNKKREEKLSQNSKETVLEFSRASFGSVKTTTITHRGGVYFVQHSNKDSLSKMKVDWKIIENMGVNVGFPEEVKIEEFFEEQEDEKEEENEEYFDEELEKEDGPDDIEW